MLRALSLCTCCRHYPGAADGRRFRSVAQPYQPSPVRRPGRPAQCPFRGLLGVHLRCGLHTALSPVRDTLIRRLQPFRLLDDCSGCFRRERIARVGLAPTGKRRLVTAHVVSGLGGPKVLRRLDLQVRKSIEVPRPGANDYHVPAGPGCPQVTPACWSPKSSGILLAVILLYLQSFGEVMDLEHCERPVYRGSSLQLARHQKWSGLECHSAGILSSDRDRGSIFRTA